MATTIFKNFTSFYREQTDKFFNHIDIDFLFFMVIKNLNLHFEYIQPYSILSLKFAQ